MAPKATIVAAALGAALAGPASAQGQEQQQPQSSGQQRSRQQATGQERLRQQLTQAGFRDVRTLDATCLVQARAQDGGVVLMTANPPDAESRAYGSGGDGGDQSDSGGGWPVRRGPWPDAMNPPRGGLARRAASGRRGAPARADR